MHVKHNNLSMLTPTLVSGRHKPVVCHASGVATVLEDIVSQVALGDTGAATSTSLLLLGPPGVGKLAALAHQVHHKKQLLLRVFSNAGHPNNVQHPGDPFYLLAAMLLPLKLALVC